MRAELREAKPRQHVEGGEPRPGLCPAPGSRVQSRQWPCWQEVPPPGATPRCPTPAQAGVRWPRTVGQLDSASTRGGSSSPELSGVRPKSERERFSDQAAASFQPRHPAWYPRRVRVARVSAERPGSSCAKQDGPGLELLRLQVGSPPARGHAATARVRGRRGRLSHGRRSLLCRKVVSSEEAVLSAAVALSRGPKTSERHLLLLQEQLVVAKLQ